MLVKLVISARANRNIKRAMSDISSSIDKTIRRVMRPEKEWIFILLLFEIPHNFQSFRKHIHIFHINAVENRLYLVNLAQMQQ